MTRKEENETLIKKLSMSFNGTLEEGKVFMLGNIVAILIDISKSLAVIADEKSEDAQPHMKNTDPEIDKQNDLLTYYVTTCSNCGCVSPIGDYCIWCGEKDTCLGDGEGDHK